MSAKAIGAIKVQNEKGEDTVEKVKIRRYFPGKAPVQREEDDLDEDFQFIKKDKKEEKPSSAIDSLEGVDRRLQRLRENKSSVEESRARHREIYEGEVVSSRGRERSESPEKSEEEKEEDEEEIDRKRALLRERARKQREEQENQEELLKALEGREEESEEEESSEYETDSEEDAFPTRQLAKPVFIPKGERKTIEERDRMLKEEEEIQMKNEEKKRARLEETQQLVADEVRKMVEGNPEEAKEHRPEDVDDTDGVNETEEYEKWKLRELMRIKREREERNQIEKEKEEIERRRQMTDKEIIEENKSIPEKNRQDKSKYKYLQKYYHKGAYYQDEEILKRDYNAPTGEDKFNKELLPKAMQVKNFGFSGRTKYTHLQDQDTSKPDAGWSQKNAINMRMTHKLGGMEKPSSKKRKHGD